MTMCELQHKRTHESYRQFLCFIAFVCCLLLGCTKSSTENLPEVTSSSERASRRAFNGSPPVIPHQPFGAACVSCHNESGRLVAKIGFAPANPHKGDGRTTNCRQCHLFKTGDSETIFVKNNFQPFEIDHPKGDRLFAGAPPTIPHTLLMRKNCMACHSGPAARPEIICDHTERSNCVQCHVPKVTDEVFSAN